MGKRDRERRRDAVSDNESESSDDGRSRRRKNDRKKKAKKDKKHRKSGHKKSHQASTPRPDYKKALVVVQELLGEFPELLKELVGLLQMLDDGEVAVISGIENKRVRSKLKELFPLLGLSELSEPKGSFAKRGEARDDDTSLLEVFQRMLTTGMAGADKNGDEEESKEANDDTPSATAAVFPKSSSHIEVAKRRAPIGPAMPPGGFTASSAYTVESNGDDDEDDDEVVGPALPGMKGFRPADERVEAEMARRALELKQAEWDRARGATSSSDAAKDKSAPLARQEWMTVMPEKSFFKDSLAPANRPPGKPAAFRTCDNFVLYGLIRITSDSHAHLLTVDAAFCLVTRSKEPAAVDHTWFDAPEERDRARRAKLDMELLGYVREENAPSVASSFSVSRMSAAAASQGAGVNESIVPAANPEADEKMRKQMERLRQERGPSLLEQHQQRLAEEAKAAGKGGKAKAKAVWDRDRDLTARRGMSNDDATKIIEASRGINSKFTAPTISRQFL